MARLSRLTSRLLRTARVCAPATATSDLISQIQTPTLAWGDIKTGATPWYSDAGTTPAVPTDGVYRLTEHIAGTQYFQQTTAGARGTLTAASYNSHSGISFDAGDGYATASNLGKTGDAELEVVVASSNDFDAFRFYWAIGSDAAEALGALCANSGGSGDKARVTDNAAAHRIYSPAIDTNMHIVRVVKTAGARPRLWVDGTELTGDTGCSTAALNVIDATMKMGQSQHGAISNTLKGTLLCLLYYATPLASDALRAADDAAIADWYGL